MSSRRYAIPILAAILVIALISFFLPPLVGGPGTSPSPTLSGGSAGTGSESPAGQLRQVRLLLGFQPDVQFAPFYLAQQQGYFAAVGLEVTIEHSDDVIPLVADGQAEFGVADATDVMIARTSGIPLKYVSTLYHRFPVALIGAPDVVPAAPADLAGLRIGTPGPFGSSWHALLALLDAGGLSPDDITIRDYPQFNQVEGLLNGDVDLITGFRTNEPLRLGAQGFEVELMTVDDFAPLPGPGLVVGDELLAQDREMVLAFADAVVNAQQDISENTQLGVDAAVAEVPAIADDRETALAVLTATVEAWHGQTGGLCGCIDGSLWATAFQTMVRLGFIDGSVPVEQMFEPVMGGPA